MIDFHSHILPGIDDGSKNLEDTLKMLKEAKEVGFTKIISTSHYLDGYYEVEEKERIELLEELKKQQKDIELYLGSEIYISDVMIEFLKGKKASTINNSRYVLFELPMNSKTMLAKEAIYQLRGNGYIPIIAHPERYCYIQDDIKYLEELAEMGALFQSNYGSIIGIYGKKAEKTVKKLLKQDFIQFLGSDVHRPNQIYHNIPKIMKKLKRIISSEKIEELTTINPQKVLDNEEI